MKTLSYITKTARLTTGDEWKVLFFICNTLGLNKTDEIEIDRVNIAKFAGWWNENKPTYSLKKVTNITNSLVEKGLIKKRLIFDKCTTERKVFYSIPTLEDGKVMHKNIPSNRIYKHDRNKECIACTDVYIEHSLTKEEANDKKEYNDGLPF